MSLAITTVSNTSATLTLTAGQVPSQSLPGIDEFIKNCISNGKGLFDDTGVWYPSSAILKIVPSITIS